jgi:hypothetical protein
MKLQAQSIPKHLLTGVVLLQEHARFILRLSPELSGFSVYSRRKMEYKDTPLQSYGLVLAFTKLLIQRLLSMLSDSAWRHKGILHETAFL